MSRALRRTFRIGDEAVALDLRLEDGRLTGSAVRGEVREEIDVPVRRLDAHTVRFVLEGRSLRATVAREGDLAWVALEGRAVEVAIEEPGAARAQAGGDQDFAASPMTGTVVKVAVAGGDQVAADAELFVVEAMKMEYVVRAPRDVVVGEVRAAAGDTVEQGAVVVTFAEAS